MPLAANVIVESLLCAQGLREQGGVALSLEHVCRDLLQKRDRVVIDVAPQAAIDRVEDAIEVGVPRPPEVLRQTQQTLAQLGHEPPNDRGASSLPEITTDRACATGRARE
jgi:hypothetical protein